MPTFFKHGPLATTINLDPKFQDLLNTPFDFSNITKASVESAMATIIKEKNDLQAQLKSIPRDQLSFETLFQPEINLDTLLSKLGILVHFPAEFHTVAEVREASVSAEKVLSDFSIEKAYDYELYQQYDYYFKAVYPKEKDQLSSEKQKLVEDAMIGCRRIGLHLGAEERQQLEEMSKMLSQLEIQYSDNLNQENFQMEVSPERLKGLPDSWFNADRRLDNGNYRVTLKYPDYLPIMDYCEDRSLRQEMYMHYNQRCMPQNLELLKQILILRSKIATLLGYDNHADYACERNMIGSGTFALQFLKGMHDSFLPVYLAEAEALQCFAQTLMGPDFEMKAYDTAYFSRLYKKATIDIDDKALQQYFPIDYTIRRTLDIYQEILGLIFEPQPDEPVWHPDVMCFAVYNHITEIGARGPLVGYFYLDLHPRGGKYGHAAAFDITQAHSIANLTGTPGDRAYPITIMACNFEKGSTLTFDEVETFFHEFGHVMHNTCSLTELAQHAAFRVQQDFIEAPSQMLENWCYHPEAIQVLSKHVETGDAISNDLAQKIRHSRQFHAGHMNYRQNFYGMIDMLLHSMSTEALEKLDLQQFESEFYQHHYGKTKEPNTSILASFGHLMGYDAHYYSYMWSVIAAQSMYKKIFSGNPFSLEAGQKYRRIILAQGGKKDANTLLDEFLDGQKPNPADFFESYGVEQDPRRSMPKLTA